MKGRRTSRCPPPLFPNRIRIFTAMPAPAINYPVFTVTGSPKIVPVVLPPSADLSLSGRIRNIQIRGTDHSGWLNFTKSAGWQVSKDMEMEGYVLLEDLYRAEGNEAGWAAYQRYLKDWQARRTTKSFPFHLLPKEVQNRQQGQIAPEFQDPWNLPAPPATTGVVSEPKPKKSKASEE